MWYAQLGFQSVIWTQLGTRVGLWVAYALLIAAVGFLSASLAIWARPDAADGSTIRINGDTIEVGKGVSSKSARRVAVVISLIVGLMFGSQFNANWSEILLMFNAQSFGTTDPQFGIDNGFYVFVLPGLKLIMSQCRCCCLPASSSPSSRMYDGRHPNHHASAWSWTVPHHQACA